MAKSKKNYKRVVLNLPPKTAATLEYLISIAQVARTKSDLFVQILNDYVDNKRDLLNDSKSWRSFTEKFDERKLGKVDEILNQYLNEFDDYSEEDED